MTGQAERVRRYYDDNTTRFLRFGQGGDGSIHRAVWGPGVRDRAAAMAYVDGLVIEQLKSLAPAGERLRVVDLGAGVCASLCRMARQVSLEGTGVTISGTQVELARRRIEAAGLTASVRCIEADFCRLPDGIGPVDLAFAVESFVHAASAGDFFHQCAALVRPGGSVIVCDDFVTQPSPLELPPASRWLERFRRGWVAPNVVAPDEARRLATAAGFVHERTIDLTPYLELGRPRDRAIALVMRTLGWLPVPSAYWSMLYGGDALQVCLRRGWLRHLFMVWKRQPILDSRQV